MAACDTPRGMDWIQLETALTAAQTPQDIYQAIVNAPFVQPIETALLSLGIIVLLLVNPDTKTIDRIALADTELAQRTVEVSAVPFSEIKLPLDARDNIIAQTIRTNKPFGTGDWRTLFSPVLNPEQARINQANAGIAYSVAYPLSAGDGGALIYSYFQYGHLITNTHAEFMKRYTQLVDKHLRALTPAPKHHGKP